MSDLTELPDPALTTTAPADGLFVSYPDSPFQLFQPYPPAGDQPTAIEQLIEGVQDGLAYQGANPQGDTIAPASPAYKVAMPAGGSMIGSALGGSPATAATAGTLPADFDAAGFERNAKVNFILLQAANDAGNVEDIRQFTTPEMFAELKMALAERGTATQKTDVVSIEAKVIDVEEDADRYVVSVRFDGVLRDDSGSADESFSEVWHLTKSRQANSGWLLSGIQQIA